MRRIAPPSQYTEGPGLALGSAAAASERDPRPLGSIGHGARLDREPDGTRSRWYALAASGGIHAVLAALLLVRIQPELPPVPPGTMQVTYVTLPGDPPSGDPKGDEAPARTAPAAETPEPAKADPVPVAETPSPEPQPAETKPADGAAPEQTAAPPGPVVNPDNPGSGTLAMGARTHGDAQGLDPALVASVSLALATRIRACWEQPVGTAPNDLASSVIVRYAPDGTVQGDPTVVHVLDGRETPVSKPNEWETQAAEAAKRCSPIQLPRNLYAYWREVEIQVYSVR